MGTGGSCRPQGHGWQDLYTAVSLLILSLQALGLVFSKNIIFHVYPIINI